MTPTTYHDLQEAHAFPLAGVGPTVLLFFDSSVCVVFGRNLPLRLFVFKETLRQMARDFSVIADTQRAAPIRH